MNTKNLLSGAIHGAKRVGRALIGSDVRALNKRMGETAGDLSDEAQKKLSRIRKSHIQKAEKYQHAVRKTTAIAGGTAAGGVGLGALVAHGGKNKMKDKTASAFLTPGFNGFMAEMAKSAGYKTDKAEGEGAGKSKEGKAAASPTPVGGTKTPKSSSAAPATGSKGGAAHKSDPDDDEGYE